MTQQHPITPSLELVQQWASESLATQNLCNRAAQWGADQELEACCEWLGCGWKDIELVDKLRSARRPKPPSLKELALEAMRRNYNPDNSDDFAIIRRALEQLND